MFKVGQKVYDILAQKWGEVDSIDSGEVTYPIEVGFEDGDTRWYTYDGRYAEEDKLRCLYWDVPTVIGGDKPPYESEHIGKTMTIRYGCSSVWKFVVTSEDETHIHGHLISSDTMMHFLKRNILECFVATPVRLQGMLGEG